MNIARGAGHAQGNLWPIDPPTQPAAARRIAELIQARRAGDHRRVRQALKVLRTRHGIALRFASELEGGRG